MRPVRKLSSLGSGAFSLVELMVAATILGFIMAGVYASSTSLISSMTAAENYSVGQLQAIDYLSLDLRRATSYAFTNDGTNLTLPLDLTLPQYYGSDGRTPSTPQRTVVTSANKKDKKKHKVFAARYYYHYGALGSTVAVKYYLLNGTLYRKEGSLPTRVVGTGISTVTFGPSATAIAADPMVSATITFLATKRAKQAPPPLSSTTFMRQFYYSDYN